MEIRGSGIRATGLLLFGFLFCATTIRAQVQVGSDTQLNLDGNISVGYSGSTSNEGPDSHGLGFGGVGNLSGSYHSPQFLSFNVVPFYNQSRNNSNYQSITDSTGVTANANIFSGSKFPGTVNYSKIFDNTSNNFVVPGLTNYATSGNTQTFGVGWAANFQSLPSFNFGYQQGDNNYSLYGTQEESSSYFRSAYGTAVYTIDGFHLNGGIHYVNTNAVYPVLQPGAPQETSSGDSTTYNFGLSRVLDLHGSTWVNFTRTTTDYDYLNVSDHQSADIVTGGVSLKPTAKLSTQFGADYNDNLAGSIFQQVTSGGAIVPIVISGEPSHSWGVYGDAQYSVMKGLYVDGIMTYRQQLFEGNSYDSASYGGSVSYGRRLLGGQLSASTTVTHNTSGSGGESTLGLLSNVIYFRRVGEWSLSGSFGYSQNTQTVLIAYTSSGYSYSLTASRRIGRLYWNGSASASKSMINQASNLNTDTQSYSTGLSGRWLSVNGSYAKSSGTGLITPTGITPPPPGVVLPPLVPTLLYSGTTYSAGVGSTPVRGLTFSGSYVNSRSNTVNGALASNNKMEQANAYLTYRFRKVYFNAGYSRLLQGFSGTELPPALLNTYYVGVSRWFKVF
jgi:hypothetical protein